MVFNNYAKSVPGVRWGIKHGCVHCADTGDLYPVAIYRNGEILFYVGKYLFVMFYNH